MIFVSVSQFQQEEGPCRGLLRALWNFSKVRCLVWLWRAGTDAGWRVASPQQQTPAPAQWGWGGGAGRYSPPPVVADAATRPHHTIGCTESFHLPLTVCWHCGPQPTHYTRHHPAHADKYKVVLCLGNPPHICCMFHHAWGLGPIWGTWS